MDLEQPVEKKPVVEKERRLNRVGLSYKCKYCGLPKKGHVCTGKPVGDGSSAGAGKSGADKAPAKPQASPPQEQDKERDEVLGAAAICADIKSVVSAAAGTKSKGGSKRKAAKPQAPPEQQGKDEDDEERDEVWGAAAICADIRSVVSAAGAKKGGPKRKRQDIETLDSIRPPSLITPDDCDASRGLRSTDLLGGPPSMLSSFLGPGSSNNLSPGTLIGPTLGTPAPPLPTPGLSPGTLDVMGGLVHRELRSTRRRQQELRRLASLA